MKRDVLIEATRALRESTEREGPPPRPDETRARVMASLRAAQARRLSIARVAVPLAAVLVGSLAWAATEGKGPASLRALLLPRDAAPAEPAAPSRSGDPQTPATGAPPETPAPPTQAVTMAETPNPPDPAPRVAATSTVGPRAAPRPGPVRNPPPADDADDALYARAHHLHFVERNPGAALAAWEAYLRAFPRGRLALESRYNRALCLVRLGRYDEASAALAPFAGGANGGYRQAEARALLEAMRSAPP